MNRKKSYEVSYWDNPSDMPRDLVITAYSRRDAIRQVRKLVSDGYRGQSGASLDLGNAAYVCSNRYGRAVGNLTVFNQF